MIEWIIAAALQGAYRTLGCQEVIAMKPTVFRFIVLLGLVLALTALDSTNAAIRELKAQFPRRFANL